MSVAIGRNRHSQVQVGQVIQASKGDNPLLIYAQPSFEKIERQKKRGDFLPPNKKCCPHFTKLSSVNSGRVITLKGVKPEGRYQWGRSTFWLYGLVKPLTDESYFEQFDHLNSEHFEQFIHQFVARYAEDVVVIQRDQASAHRAQEIDWPETIIPLFQPAYTPEVNPIERFWKPLKTPLQWEIFQNLKALRQRVQAVLSEMTKDVIRLVTGWDFITNAALSASSN